MAQANCQALTSYPSSTKGLLARAVDTTASRTLIDQLESRNLLAVSLSIDGWTDVTPAADTRIVYVSDSRGTDANSGLAADQPVKTLAKGRSLLRRGGADWLLLRKGDTWENQNFQGFWAMGRSAQEPTLISSYTDAANLPTDGRPLIESGRADGLSLYGSHGNLAIIGLEFVAHTYDGTGSKPVGMRFWADGSNFLVEDTVIRGFGDAMLFSTPSVVAKNLVLRRSQLLDSFHDLSAHSQGLYISGSADGVLMEENLFDHNGWSENPALNAPKTIYNHNVYVYQTAKNITARGNVFARGSLHGAMIRPGGTIQNNLFVGNAVGLMVGANQDTVISGNVILEGADVGNFEHGIGMNIQSESAALVYDNIVAHDASRSGVASFGIQLNAQATNVQIQGNIVYNWNDNLKTTSSGPLWVEQNHFQQPAGAWPIVDFDVTYNAAKHTFSKNVYSADNTNAFNLNRSRKSFSQWTAAVNDSGSEWRSVNYTDPTRDLGDLARVLGYGDTATTDTWLMEARTNSRGHYRTGLTASKAIAFVRSGFDLSEMPSNILPQHYKVGFTRLSIAPTGGLGFGGSAGLDLGNSTDRMRDLQLWIARVRGQAILP